MKSKTVKLISGVAVLAVLSGTYIGVTSYVDSQEEKEAEAADTSVSVVEMDSEKLLLSLLTAQREQKRFLRRMETSG